MPPLEEVDLEESEGPRPSGKGYRVLYVEDEEVNWVVTQKKLERFCQMRRAQDSKEALQVLAENWAEVILMDIQLMNSPMDGIQLTQVLRAGAQELPEPARTSVQKIPILFVTAYSSRYSEKMLLGLGGDALLTKPVNFPGLVAKMTSLIADRITGARLS